MAIEINIPDIGVDEVEVTEILVKSGDNVNKEQSLITVEGDKASIEIPSPFSGTVKELKVNVGDKVSTGSLIMTFEEEGVLSTNDIVQVRQEPFNISAAKIDSETEFTEDNNYIHASPLIRRLAREFKINLSKVRGTGRKGRILLEDIQVYIKEVINHAESNQTKEINNYVPKLSEWPKVDFHQFGEVEKIELGRIQKISGTNLSRNWAMIPHVTHFDKVDITELENFRKQQNIEAEKSKLDVKITLVVFVMKVVAYALEQMPRFNSSLSEDNQHLILKKYINIGVAVDTQNGLMVPVFKNVNKKGIIELSRELVTITNKARNSKLTAIEMQGGCFTISSIGNIGTTYFTPIVNAPEVAILGISKSSIEQVWNDSKEFVPRLMLPISLSFDHRVIDGADGARFINIIHKALSDIRYLLM